jgi:dihydrofolate reductase
MQRGEKEKQAMREVVAVTQITLDGVMQAPGAPEEDPSGGFAYGGWSIPYFDDVLGEAAEEAFTKPFDLLLGRKTYEIFAAHWPYDEGPIADRLNSATKHVASRTLKGLDWNNSTLLEGEVETAVAALKQRDGPKLQVLGSSELLQTLLAAGLVDEFRLWIFPVVVGRGKRLFDDNVVPAGLELVDSKVSTSGVIAASYRRVGEVQTGSFAFEEPTERELRRREAMKAEESATSGGSD